ncbi:MAG: helix-turn-helix transcriptional regulator [Alphaproteobacteria bacterium]
MSLDIFSKNWMVKLTLRGMMISGLFFLFDVFIDLYEHYSRSQPYSNDELVHLLFELGAVVALILGMFSLLQYNNLLRSHNELATQQLSALQKDFERHVHSKFDFWEFTAAERDIALLLLKGFSTASISEFRATQIGTVKVQVHNLLKKARVNSRIEFMSLFMDEFLDIGIVAGLNSKDEVVVEENLT